MSRSSSRSSSGRSKDRSSGLKNRLRQDGGTARRRSSGDGAASNWSRHGTALPDWTDLEPRKNRRREAPSSDESSFIERISTVRFAIIVLVLAGTFTLYVGHVHATRSLLNEVQELRTTNKRLHLKRNRLQGQFARKTSPSVIYERARELGLRASVTYGPPISIDE